MGNPQIFHGPDISPKIDVGGAYSMRFSVTGNDDYLYSLIRSSNDQIRGGSVRGMFFDFLDIVNYVP